MASDKSDGAVNHTIDTGGMRLPRILSALLLGLCAVLASPILLAQGTLERISVYGSSLAGNLQGDDPQREVFVYLPPGYDESDRHYPVVYFLHGYAVGADVYVNQVLDLPAAADAAMAAGARETIIVMPDAFNRFGGSFYSNSPTIGDWERFIARDLVAYIDSHYRTVARREGRGLSGHSMGGYGTLRVGMAYPQVFNALYSMSAGAVLESIPAPAEVAEQWQRMAAGIETEARTFANGMQAKAAAWSPDPATPPYFLQLPYDADGNPEALVAEKWLANSLLVMVDQAVPALRGFAAIMLDVGNEDGLEANITRLDASLTRLGVEHGYVIYEGNHGNRVGQRFIDEVLPFFAEHLDEQ